MIDYRKLIPFVLENEGELVHGHYYTCMSYQQQNPTDSEKRAYSKQRKLLRLITNLPNMTVRLGKLQKKHDTFVQKLVDVLLALDMARIILVMLQDVLTAYIALKTGNGSIPVMSRAVTMYAMSPDPGFADFT